MTAIRILLHALSPLHPGSGEAESGIEQGIARDRATGRPLLPGSSLKGVLRDAARSTRAGRTAMSSGLLQEVFGPDTQRAHEHRGAVAFGDANLLVMPARSVVGTFAWVTCPDVLRRWTQLHVSLAGLDEIKYETPTVDSADCALVASGDAIIATDVGGESMVYFEDLNLRSTVCTNALEWATHFASLAFPGDGAWEGWRKLFARRFCIVHDDVFSFLCDYATQIDPHVALDENKSVQNLWHEESIPAESLLGSISVIDPLTGMKASADAIGKELRGICTHALQFGGHETVGRGVSRVLLDGGTFSIPQEVGA